MSHKTLTPVARAALVALAALAGVVLPATLPHAEERGFGSRLASARVSEGASPWDKAMTSSLRLVSAQTGAIPAPGTSTLAAGIEITLDDGWKTYWHNPGDTGIAPMFDFSKSTNVSATEISYPVPERFDLPGDISFGYKNKVVFPITVTPSLPGEPVVLVAEIVYGACEELCIPVTANVELDLPATKGGTSAFAGMLAEWVGRVPANHDASLKDVSAMSRGGKDYMQVIVDARKPLQNPALIAVPTGGDGRVYVGTPQTNVEGTQAVFEFPVKALKNRPGMDAGIEFSFTFADHVDEREDPTHPPLWAQQFTYVMAAAH